VTHEPKEGNDPVQFCTGAAGLPGRLSGIFLQCRTQYSDAIWFSKARARYRRFLPIQVAPARVR